MIFLSASGLYQANTLTASAPIFFILATDQLLILLEILPPVFSSKIESSNVTISPFLGLKISMEIGNA